MEYMEVIIQIGATISAIGIIVFTIKKPTEKWVNSFIDPIHMKIEHLDKSQCRNYLVDFLADIENGIAKTDSQVQRASELYDHYKYTLNGNSYIQDKWQKLMKGG